MTFVVRFVISHQTFRFANFLFKFAKIAIRFAKFLPGLRCLPYGLRNFQVCLQIGTSDKMWSPGG